VMSATDSIGTTNAEPRRVEAFLELIRRSRRGRLKVYLGYAAGVGKTYRMLREGHDLLDSGVDVVVGYVETHGRSEIERLAEDLPTVPRRSVEYRGIALEEMDVAAILERRPEVTLVDELAHTNAPGSKHEKRYEDVEDLLAAGIHVITTMNVQHLESLYETVQRVTGVRVVERVPDRLLAEADQIVNVDVSEEDLRERLRRGDVYGEERIERALANFFQQPNLKRLRNLTLREIASHLEAQDRTPGEEEDRFAAPDQVLVCLSSAGPDADALLRYGSRLAGKLNRTWYALYVQRPREAPTRIELGVQRQLAETLELANELGATLFTLEGEDVVETILGFVREYAVGHVVVGRSGQTSWLHRLLGRPSMVQRLLDAAAGVAVVVVDTATGVGRP